MCALLSCINLIFTGAYIGIPAWLSIQKFDNYSLVKNVQFSFTYESRKKPHNSPSSIQNISPKDQPSFISNCMHVIIQMRQICAAYCTYKYSLILLQRSNRLAYLCTNSPIFVSISSPFFFAHVKLTSKWPIGH